MSRHVSYYLDENHEPHPFDPCTPEGTERMRRVFEYDARRVANTEREGARVSTVFLVVDHNFFGEGPPILFESLVFGGPLDGQMERYATWAEAEAGRARICARVFGDDMRARGPS